MEIKKIKKELKEIKNLIKNNKKIIFNKQKNKNIEKYFQENFQTLFLPQDFLLFVEEFDGAKILDFDIFSIQQDQKSYFAMTYENYSTPDYIEKYCSAHTAKPKDSKLFFFASDNFGGKYAFKTNVEDNQVYYLPNFPLDQIIVYDSFLNLVKQKIKEATL